MPHPEVSRAAFVRQKLPRPVRPIGSVPRPASPRMFMATSTKMGTSNTMDRHRCSNPRYCQAAPFRPDLQPSPETQFLRQSLVDRVQRLIPAADLLEDVLRLGGPDERLRVAVGLG